MADRQSTMNGHLELLGSGSKHLNIMTVENKT